MAQVLEWAPFELAPGVDEAALVAAAEALQRDFLSKQPGFVRRELLRAGERRWVDLVYWSSRETADAAMKHAMESPACHGYFQLMVLPDGADPAAGVMHLDQVRTFAA